MATIWKYPVGNKTHFTLKLPAQAQILSVQTQFGEPQLWALVNPDAPKTERHFVIVGTGWDIEENGLQFLGTFQQAAGSFVLHLFEKTA